MPILNIFSKREKQKRGEFPDIFQYELLPDEFRVKVVHILRDALGDTNKHGSQTEQAFEVIHDSLCREYGLFHLSREAEYNKHFQLAVFNFFLACEDIEKALDVIELSFKIVDTVGKDPYYRNRSDAKIKPDEAIAELNARFLEHGIGYQFEAGEIIRIDSKYIHTEAIKPTLHVLGEKIYAGANDEFLKAHDHYRHKRYKECINECLKSFESTMKAICQKRKWTYNSNDTAKNLLNICFQNGLMPDFLLSQFSSLRASLESGVPTIRNKLSGHGQGTSPKDAPQFMARYLLNLTATSIILLTDAERELPR